MHIAVRNGFHELASILKSHGAKADIENDDGKIVMTDIGNTEGSTVRGREDDDDDDFVDSELANSNNRVNIIDNRLQNRRNIMDELVRSANSQSLLSSLGLRSQLSNTYDLYETDDLTKHLTEFYNNNGGKRMVLHVMGGGAKKTDKKTNGTRKRNMYSDFSDKYEEVKRNNFMFAYGDTESNISPMSGGESSNNQNSSSTPMVSNTEKVHNETIELIKQTLKVDDATARIYKAVLYKMAKENNPQVGSFERANAMKSMVKKEVLSKIDVDKARAEIKKHYDDKRAASSSSASSSSASSSSLELSATSKMESSKSASKSSPELSATSASNAPKSGKISRSESSSTLGFYSN